ncbi:MAG: hydrolase [Phycisphaerales bacterium]|nr:hydrolase [Phycisphaerales bacterium]
MNHSRVALGVCLLLAGAVGGYALSNVSIEPAAIAQGSAPATSPPRPTTGPGWQKTWAPGGKHERFTPDNCVFAFVDHQTGLMNIVDNTDPVGFKNYVIALAKLAKLHNVPVVLTTSAETGPNGPLLPEIVQQFPGTPIISRPGQINAWDNADFVAAIQKTGKKKIVMSGITTDVCVTFAALSALDAGYDVYVVVDASGSMSEQTQTASLMRMQQAGATIGTWFGISCELLSDWRNPAGEGSAKLFVEHFQSYGSVFQSWDAQQKAKKPGN